MFINLILTLITPYIAFRIYKCLYVLLRIVFYWYILPKTDLNPYKSHWTVITGGTDGIGKAYVYELVKRGIRKIILIGRNADKLQKLCLNLEKAYGCQMKYVKFDFESDSFDKLKIPETDIGILVNCAGIAPSSIDRFSDHPIGLSSTILRVNLMSAVKMIELILPGMVERNFGIIVNVSSMTGWRPFPFLSTYPASKAAISFISQSLHDEYRKTNVKIQTLMPILVATKMSFYTDQQADGYLVVSAEKFAIDAIDIIGKHSIVTGCRLHELQIALGSLISYYIFKTLFVPLVLLTTHRSRLQTINSNQSTSSDTDKSM